MPAGKQNPDEFVEIVNENGPISATNPLDVSLPAGGSSITVEGTDAQPIGNDITVDQTAGGIVLVAANANRRSAVIQNTSGNPMRVGIDTDPDADTGAYLQAYDILTTDAKDIIKGYATTTDNATVYAQEFE